MENKLLSALIISNTKRDAGFVYANKVRDYLVSIGCSADITDIREISSADADYCIVIGGDGTMLHAANAAAVNDTPIIGINLGHLGYMAELEEDEYKLLSDISRGIYSYERRMMLSTSVIRADGKETETFCSLNDSTISNSELLGMVDMELRCDGGVVGHYRADGIICATPTGSTAYSLSAGGPVVDPALNCICVTVVSPHSLRVRPMIFSPESILELQEYRSMGGEYYLTLDGNTNIRLRSKDLIRICRSDRSVRFIKLKKHRFYDTLNDKMSE